LIDFLLSGYDKWQENKKNTRTNKWIFIGKDNLMNNQDCLLARLLMSCSN
jgi:hypothetical protein